MSSKPTFSVSGLKTVMERTKHKVLQKVGKVEGTVDVHFNQEFDKVKAQKKLMKNMIKGVKDYCKALQGECLSVGELLFGLLSLSLSLSLLSLFHSLTFFALLTNASVRTVISESHTILCDGISTFYDSTSPMYQANAKNQEIAHEIDQARQAMVCILFHWGGGVLVFTDTCKDAGEIINSPFACQSLCIHSLWPWIRISCCPLLRTCLSMWS